MLILVFLLLHLATIVLFLNEKRKNKLFLDAYLTVILCLFPVVGAVSVIYINKEKVNADSNSSLSFEEVIPWLTDESLDEEVEIRGITDIDAKAVIPFQEALLLNNASIKRGLIIDIIFESPDQFVPLLHQARLNEDVEVVHYATTILSELTAKYDANLHALERQIEKNQDSLQAKIDYLLFLEKYIDSTLAEGYYGNTLKHHYANLVQNLIDQEILLEKKSFIKLAEIYLEFKDRQRFTELLEKMQFLFPEEEEIWMLKLKAIITRNSQQELSDFLREIKESHIYLSAKNREVLAFWQ